MATPGAKQRCMECNEPVAGIPNLFLGTPPNGRLCVTCVVKLQMEHEAPTAMTYFVSWYVKRVADRKKPTELDRLRERIDYLETELGVVSNDSAVSYARPGNNVVPHVRRARRGRGR